MTQEPTNYDVPTFEVIEGGGDALRDELMRRIVAIEPCGELIKQLTPRGKGNIYIVKPTSGE